MLSKLIGSVLRNTVEIPAVRDSALASTAGTPTPEVPLNRASQSGVDWSRYGGVRNFSGAPARSIDHGLDPSTFIPDGAIQRNLDEVSQAKGIGAFFRAAIDAHTKNQTLINSVPATPTHLGSSAVDWSKYGGVRNHNPMAAALRAAPSTGDSDAVSTI